ncbi:MAG: tRNA (adenosine(37)-N6)-threonylcarbamoyltransferase complex transferase subunit TsaD [Candidatus Peregrinibacteria bacterium]|nr:tRNA (adenosine(37)-N6)-threonylcarbamoyltransferase complex transferase subunit TsaD [Candidatus Peregrinibacteria bacterium]MDZ4244583.1 tRNA (adenosine(37)-N6)-threonylcarbamoyltransferase complex transferase subunit TsaD [Candidatus Gracilibacteria bacterium]
MIILSIESTCDETSVAIVEDGMIVYCNVIYSQIAEHNKTGGVVPEVAARRHVEAIVPVVNEALRQGGVKMGILEGHDTIQKLEAVIDKIDAIAVAQGPGLLGCLMVGNNAATALSLIWNKPIIPIHHIEGHLYASWLTDNCEKHDDGTFVHEILPYDIERDQKNKFPILILTVSGGHNQLITMRNHGEYELLGETLDDAAGEAFDKVARMLGLGYPGGPEIQKTASKGNKANGFAPGDPNKYKLPRAMMYNEHASDFNFSFSGLKTAMRTLILENGGGKHDNIGIEFEKLVPDMAASFEHTICDTLLIKLKKAAELTNPKEIHIAGGVSANLRLRGMLEATFPQNIGGPRILYPSLKFCTDNAAMLGAVAYFRYMANPEQYKAWQNSIPDTQLKFY